MTAFCQKIYSFFGEDWLFQNLENFYGRVRFTHRLKKLLLAGLTQINGNHHLNNPLDLCIHKNDEIKRSFGILAKAGIQRLLRKF